jgi:hypothetical protein
MHQFLLVMKQELELPRPGHIRTSESTFIGNDDLYQEVSNHDSNKKNYTIMIGLGLGRPIGYV